MSKVVIIDWSVFMFTSIFASLHNQSVPSTYTALNMIVSNLKRIGITPDDRIIIACDKGHSWRKNVDPCLIKDTEVLTEDGWKLLKDIVKNNEKIKVATLNQKTNKVEYQYPTDYHEFYYKGKLYNFGGQNCRVDIIMTPEHRHYIKKQHQKEHYLMKVKDISNNSEVEHNRKFNYDRKGLKYFIIPKLKTKSISYRKDVKYTYIVDYPKRKIEINLWLEFLGWYLSEGSCGGRRYCGHVKPYSIVIPQSIEHNPKYCKEIEDLLSNFGSVCKHKRPNVMSYNIANTQLARYLKKTFGNSFNKHIPRQLLNKLSRSQCWLLLKTLIKGDGTIRKSKNTEAYSYTTVSKQLADDIQEIALKAGYTATIVLPVINRKWYGISITKNFTPRNSKHEYRGTDWDGKGLTYDLTVPNHIFFVRRKGKVCWTGNCYKANRKAGREKFPIDWDEQFASFDWLLDKVDKATDWNIVGAGSLEADDWMAVGSRYFKDNEVILITTDSDLEQMFLYPNVKIFSPKKKCKGGKGAYKIPPPNFNVYKLISQKIRKETADNLTSAILSQDDYEKRMQIVNLLELPENIENTIRERLSNLEDKDIHLELIPFKSIRARFMDIYNSNKIITIEDSMKKTKKKKKKK